MVTLLAGIAWVLLTKDIVIWVVGLAPILYAVAVFIFKALCYSNTYYAYSNKRIMMRTDFFGSIFRTIDYDRISELDVFVNLVDRAYNVGSVRFYTSGTANNSLPGKYLGSWTGVSNAYELFKMVNQTSLDIKTDYTFPNAWRPGINPGYTTTYAPVK